MINERMLRVTNSLYQILEQYDDLSVNFTPDVRLAYV